MQLSSPEEWNIIVVKAIDHGGLSDKFYSDIKELKNFVLYRIKLRVNGS